MATKLIDPSHVRDTNVGDGLNMAVTTTPLWGIWEVWCDFPSPSSPIGTSSSSATALSPSSATGSSSPLTTDPQQQNTPSSPINSRSDVFNQSLANATTWLDSVKSFGIIDTVEGFWGIHDCVVPPSRMPVGYNMFLFRHNVAPLWEHEGNRRGGKWVCQFDRTVDLAVVDAVWRDVCLLLIGEIEEVDETEVCGCVVGRRRNAYKVSLWTRHSDREEDQLKLGRIFKRCILEAMGSLTKNGSSNSSSTNVEASTIPIVYVSHCEPLPSAPLPSEELTPARDDGKRGLSSVLYSI